MEAPGEERQRLPVEVMAVNVHGPSPLPIQRERTERRGRSGRRKMNFPVALSVLVGT